MRPLILITAIALLSLALAFDSPQARAGGPIVVVDTTSDDNLLGCSPTPNDCSLRGAINLVNSGGGQNEINFGIGAGHQVIRPTTQLPTIFQSVEIDGTTQIGFEGAPIIEINGEDVTNDLTVGLLIGAPSTVIRGLVVNNMPFAGIAVVGDGRATIEGNYIGTDSTGTVAAGNGGGVQFDTADNILGGPLPAQRNVISGNTGTGVSITEDVDNVVQGNYIGVDATGNGPLGNGGYGVYTLGAETMIGGEVPGAGNVIGDNGFGGVQLIRRGDNLVQNNYIGVGADGETPLGNHEPALQHTGGGGFTGGWGVSIDSQGNEVLDNIIANNEADGIAVFGAKGPEYNNRIVSNRIYDNAGLGIDLYEDGFESGVSPNDPMDADDDRANSLFNFPDVTAYDPKTLTVSGAYNGTPDIIVIIELFASPSCDASGHGEGEMLIGFTKLETDPATGDGAWEHILDDPIPENWDITALARDEAGNTSEFSECLLTGPAFSKGDLQCDGDVDSVDALMGLRDVAGLTVSQEDGCPEIGGVARAAVTPAGRPTFGDMDCDTDVDSVDALFILRSIAALPVNLPKGCGPIGA